MVYFHSAYPAYIPTTINDKSPLSVTTLHPSNMKQHQVLCEGIEDKTLEEEDLFRGL